MNTTVLAGRARPIRRQRGLTLMEVLVSLLVMAFGLLGVAVLQTTTLRYQSGTSERASLAMLLGDFQERVRANLAQAPGEVSASPYVRDGEAAAWNSALDALPANCSSGAAITPAERAACDMAEWQRAVRRTLPNGSVSVSGTASRGMTVTFAWLDKDFSGPSATCSASTTGVAAGTCCPAALSLTTADNHVRCANFTVMP